MPATNPPAMTPGSIDELLASHLPAWLSQAPVDRLNALRRALRRQETATGRLAPVLAAIATPQAFAAPLLETLLRNAGLGQLDSRRVWVRIEQEVELPTAAPQLPRPRYTHVSRQSLLAATLHNFHIGETRPSILRKAQLQDASGNRLALGFERFAGLCRALDVGGRYQVHLTGLLRPAADPARSEQVQRGFEEALQAHMDVAVRMAALKGELDEQGYLQLLPLISAKPIVAPAPGVVTPRQLYLLGKCIRGVVAVEVRAAVGGPVQSVIAYLPGQTVTRHASWQALYDRLAERLREQPYRRYFARFISERDRAGFAVALKAQLDAAGDGVAQLDGRHLPIDGNLWVYLASQQLDKMIDDARVLVVPTGDEDEQQRRGRLDGYTSLGLELLNLASLFVPVLGEVMLTVAAVQLAAEVYEGYTAWAIGDRQAAFDHLFNVAENVAIGVLAAKGGNVVRNQLQRVAFVDELVPIASADGRIRLGTAGAADWVEPQHWAEDGQLLRGFSSRLEDVSDEMATELMQMTGFNADRLRHLHLAGENLPARVYDALEYYQLHELHPLEHGEALEQRFSDRQTEATGDEALLKRDFPGLTTRGLQEVFSQASSAELDSLVQAQRVPLAMAERARWYVREYRLDRASAGLRLARAANEDSECLAFGVLQALAPPAPSRRLELREGHAGGRLIASMGQEAAEDVEHVLRVAQGYQLDGAQGPAQGLLQVLLATLDDEQQARLGSASSLTAEGLAGQLLAAASRDREQVAGILGMPPIGAGLRPPSRLGDGRVGFLLSGRGGGSQRSIRRGFQRIYPLLTEDQMEAYLLDVLEHGESLWDHYGHVQAQLTRLRHALNTWQSQASGVRDSLRRRRVATQFRRAWRRKVSNVADEFVLVIDGEPVGSLPSLPRTVRYSHIQRLTLSNMDLAELDEDFILRFDMLVELDLRGNQLSAVPRGVEQLRNLRQLHLGNNQIVMDAASQRRLAGLARLQVLDLSMNPLGYAPDLRNLRNLRTIRLNGAALDAVPENTVWRAQMDLRENNISRIRMSLDDLRSRVDQLSLHDNPLDAASEQLLDEAAGGVQPSARGSASHRHRRVNEALLERWLGEDAGVMREERRKLWRALRREHGSSALFVYLADFVDSEDFQQHPGHYRARVWRVLELCAEHTSLRERLFLQMAGPRTCEDRLLLILGQLELGVLVEKYTANARPAQVEEKMLELARALFRLDEVDHQATLHIQRMEAANSPHIDEIEVQLFYRLKLAEALELPIELDSMHYEAFAHVSTRDLINAQEQVLRAETPEAIVESLAQRPFWEAHARERYADRFSAEAERVQTLLEESEAELKRGEIDEWLFNRRSISFMHEYEAAERRLIQTLAREVYQRLNP